MTWWYMSFIGRKKGRVGVGIIEAPLDKHQAMSVAQRLVSRIRDDVSVAAWPLIDGARLPPPHQRNRILTKEEAEAFFGESLAPVGPIAFPDENN